jgi:PAS domain S-box-containing protein
VPATQYVGPLTRPTTVHLPDFRSTFGGGESMLSLHLPLKCACVHLFTMPIPSTAAISILADDYVDSLDDASLRRELKQRNHQLKLLGEFSTDMVVLSSLEGCPLWCNDAAAQTLEMTKEELLQVPVQDLVHPDESEALEQHRRRALTSNAPLARTVHRLRRSDGAWASVHANLETIGGRITPASMLIVNQLQCQRATAPGVIVEAQRNFQLLAEASLDMIARHRPDGQMLYVSPAAAALLGYEPHMLVGRTLLDFCHPDDLNSMTMAGEFVVSSEGKDDGFAFEDARIWLEIRGNVARLRCRLRHEAGHHIWCEQVITAIRDSAGKFEELVSVTRDITRIKLHETELEEINQDLEHRIRRRTNELQSSNAELREAMGQLERTRDQLVQAEKLSSLGELVAGIAHEINTPVGVGLTAASHLREKTEIFQCAFESGNMTRSALAAFVATADESSSITVTNLERAAHLIRSFKMVAADRSSETIRTVDLPSYMHEVLISLMPQLRKQKHTAVVRASMPYEITTAPGALSQVITNLVMNSIRHGFENMRDGQIEITISQNADESLRIRYADNGHGIPKEHIKRIFDPFFTTKRGQGGTGLGLNIVFGLVKTVLRGVVEVESTMGEGTAFTFNLPPMISSTDSCFDIKSPLANELAS